ncbi:hypothetical protein L1887_40523 [Cichorium endivia]|nr:hypothetical protein L1887_40523 [Cichorium endivia]
MGEPNSTTARLRNLCGWKYDRPTGTMRTFRSRLADMAPSAMMTTPALSGSRSVAIVAAALGEDAEASALGELLVHLGIHLGLVDKREARVLAADAVAEIVVHLVHRLGRGLDRLFVVLGGVLLRHFAAQHVEGAGILELLLDPHLGVADDLDNFHGGVSARLGKHDLTLGLQLRLEGGAVSLEQKRVARRMERDVALALLRAVGGSCDGDGLHDARCCADEASLDALSAMRKATLRPEARRTSEASRSGSRNWLW